MLVPTSPSTSDILPLALTYRQALRQQAELPEGEQLDPDLDPAPAAFSALMAAIDPQLQAAASEPLVLPQIAGRVATDPQINQLAKIYRRTQLAALEQASLPARADPGWESVALAHQQLIDAIDTRPELPLWPLPPVPHE